MRLSSTQRVSNHETRDPNYSDPIIDPLLTVQEGSALLKVSVPTFWRWVAKGLLPKAVKLGGMSRWPQSEIIAFVEKAKAVRSNT